MRVVVEVQQTRSNANSPFKADGNGNMPFLLNDALTGQRLPFGGIVNGTVGQNLGLEHRGMYTMFIEKYPSKELDPKTGKPYVNFRHEVISHVTKAMDNLLAEKLVEAQFKGFSNSTPDPKVEEKPFKLVVTAFITKIKAVENPSEIAGMVSDQLEEWDGDIRLTAKELEAVKALVPKVEEEEETL